MTMYFRPDVTFNISLLRAIQMMEVPLLKSWIHTNFMDGLTKGESVYSRTLLRDFNVLRHEVFLYYNLIHIGYILFYTFYYFRI